MASGSLEQGPLDKLFRDTNTIILVIFSLCCGLIAFVLALICFLTAKDPTAKSKAQMVLIITVVMMVLGIVLNFSGLIPMPALPR